jgi:hypothetical protein
MKRWFVAAAVIILHVWMYAYYLTADPTQLQSSGMDSGISVAVGPDTQVYLEAGAAYRSHQPLYILGALSTYSDLNYHHHFRYHPAFAALMSLLPQTSAVKVGWMLFLCVSYAACLYLWTKVFNHHKFTNSLIFAAIAADWLGVLAFGNVSPFLALISVLMTLSIQREKYAQAGLLGVIALLTKPHWAFPLLLPLLNRKWRGFAITLLSAYFGYIIVNLVYLAAATPDYGLQSLRDYVTFTLTLPARIPIWGTEAMFDTMQNSLTQTFSRYLGIGVLASVLTIVTQFGALSFFAWSVYRVVVKKRGNPLLVMLLGYVTAMILLPQIDELILGGVVFAALQMGSQPLAKKFSCVYFVQALYEIPTVIAIFTGIHWLYVPEVLPVFMISLVALFSALIIELMFPTLERLFYRHAASDTLPFRKLTLVAPTERSAGDD